MSVALFWTVVAVLVVGAIVSALRLSRLDGFVPWDIAIFIFPLMTWLVLAMTGVRPKSLSNLMEPIVLALVILAAFVVRAFGFGRYSHQVRAMGTAGACVLVAVMLYAFVPLLEE